MNAPNVPPAAWTLAPEALKQLIELRRDLHQHPELAFQDVRTERRVVDAPAQSAATRLHQGDFFCDERAIEIGALAMASSAAALADA